LQCVRRKITDIGKAKEEKIMVFPPVPLTHVIPQEDEVFVTMVSLHGLAGYFYDVNKACDALGLTTKVYRDYIDSIAKAHPEVQKMQLSSWLQEEHGATVPPWSVLHCCRL
jgi:hypothetical protein